MVPYAKHLLPTSAIPIVAPASEEHEKHNDYQNSCHSFLQSKHWRLVVLKVSAVVNVKSCRHLQSGMNLVPAIISGIVCAIVVRVRVTARMTGVVAVTVITRRIARMADASAQRSCQQQWRKRDSGGFEPLWISGIA